MIIISGSIFVDPTQRDTFVQLSLAAVAAARRASGCFDFVVAPDPLEPDRVNVYERWQSESDLEAFRGAGPSADLASKILRAEVRRYHVTSSGPA